MSPVLNVKGCIDRATVYVEQMQPFRRMIHALAIIGIAGATVIASTIIALSLVVSRFVPWEKPQEGGWLLLPLGVAALGFVLVSVGIYRRVNWTTVALFAIVPCLLFAFLGMDSRSHGAADLGERAEDNDPGYQTVMWLAERSPYSRLKEMGDLAKLQTIRLPQDKEQWRKYVIGNRSAIVSAWNNQKLGREWLDALYAKTPHGVWRNRVDAPIVSFAAVRRISDITQSYALGQAYDGNADAGLETLGSLLSAMQNFQRTAPSLLNQMICSVVVKQCLAVAREIFRLRTFSAVARTKLLHVLENAPPMSLIIRNAFEGEIEFSTSALEHARDNNGAAKSGNSKVDLWIGYGMRFCGPVVFNYNRTADMVIDTLRDAERLSVDRQLDDLSKWHPRAATGLQQLKNPAGRLLGEMIIPAFEKAIRQMWSVDDTRISLLQELQNTEIK